MSGLQKPPSPPRHPGGRTCQASLALLLVAWPYYLWKGIRMERGRK